GARRRARRAYRRRPRPALRIAGDIHRRGVRHDGDHRRTSAWPDRIRAGGAWEGDVTDLRSRWSAAMMPNYGTPAVALVRGEGAVVWDDSGKSYVDFLAGIAVNVL